MQGALEDALCRLFDLPEVTTYCAGRTDAGVHALGQVVSTPDAPDGVGGVRLVRALNGLLGPRISVWAAEPAAADFHARFSARSRTYVYALLTAPAPDPFLARTALWHPDALDVEAMNEAAGHLLGEHDFSSFGRVPEGGSPVRRLFELSARRSGAIVRIRARANAFIQQMVRSLVGTLVAVGQGRMGPDEVAGVLEARERAAAGPVAPPHGLCLVAVEYDDSWKAPPGTG